MSSTKTLQLLDIPEVVLFEWLLPKLNTNTLLRLRLLCKAVKAHSDRFLSTKCPSKRKIHIFLNEDLHEGGIRLSEFLEQDSASSLKMPSSSLHLVYEPDENNPRNHWNDHLGNQLYADFLLKYGRQIKSLKVDCLILPMIPGNPEFVFYESLPNLECLDVDTIFIYDTNEATLKAENFPRCFQTKLRTLKTELVRCENDNAATKDHFWKLIELCSDLKHVRCPSAVGTFINIEEDNAMEKLSVFKNLNRLLLCESKKFKTLDLSYITLNLNQRHVRPDWEGMMEFWKNCTNLGISLINVPANFLSQFELFRLNALAGNIRSIINFSCAEDLKGVVFHNVDTVKVSSFTGQRQQITFDTIKRRLSISVFPSLKILKITSIEAGDSKYWAKLWPMLSQLEELAFELDENNHCGLEDETFFGDRVDSPAFLALENLKKLSLVAPPDFKYICISTLVFFGVIRFMRLKELHIIGSMGSVTKYGILALNLPGPFKETIELFPFRNWSYGGGSQEEFREIAKLFPTNRPY